jgi:hypothetical protein
VRFTEPTENFDHEHQDVRKQHGVQFGDLPQFMDFAFNNRVARVNALTLANLADAPATPRNVRIIAANLTNDTRLKWAANTEPDLKGYEVVWRGPVTAAPRRSQSRPRADRAGIPAAARRNASRGRGATRWSTLRSRCNTRRRDP